MIKLIFGNVGSGKTASCVRMMKNNPHKKFLTNIDVRGKEYKHVIKLKANMIIKKEVIRVKKDGTPVTKMKLNIQFWKDLLKKENKINIIIDEAHIFLNPRRSMSGLNILMSDFLALLRRILGSSDSRGQLVLITQLSRRLDVIAKEMATSVEYCINHYIKECKCEYKWIETNETANKLEECPKCFNWNIKIVKNYIDVYHFKDVNSFKEFNQFGIKSYYKRYIIKDIESVFGNYDTLQFEDLLSDL